MKLENKKEQVINMPNFYWRLWRYNLFAMSLISFSMALGTSGYHFICQLSWLDGFHMSAMILTGMGPVAEMTTVAAKLFSSFFALYSGVAFLSITAVFFAPIIHRLLHILHVEKD
ncbi:MAG: hypothetical protein IPF46_02750 [Saprospiraceae bacterium]|nr:hypothetical protein [Candidatus Vicinibacter affinis]MBK6572637.1 hypothetical protein [Candidatus Vicinibacter affinis]MBK7302997.1 hypothetical protein [Candidatus Vicinibacter affinis]MBK7696181.1 hypothetical protein [Candidatus Vicinibacter affinis]MBK7798779.1 hypothetical protein [Candidatus Vicinibacter affinis]